MKRSRWTSGIVALALTATACAGASADDAGSSAAPALTEPGAAPATDAETAPADTTVDATGDEPSDDTAESVVVPAALQFSAPLVGGNELDASTLAGKPTVFWFWAPT